jgi:hypothetical protein
MRIHCFFAILFLCSLHSYAQDSVLMNELMQRIADQQASGSTFYIYGIFPSYISNQPQFNNSKRDNNIFFTALVDYTLRHLPKEHLADSTVYNLIHSKALLTYPYFRNKNGRTTYNFWRTDTAYTFPYTNWIYKIKHNTALPDDMDDTVLSLLAQNTDSSTAAAVHIEMQEYTNASKQKSKAIEKDYRQYNAYSVWYGKNFPVVIDVCVLSNVLHFVQQYNLPWTSADSASLKVILQSITNGDYKRKPLSISPYYGNTSIILYHIARLMSSKPIPELEALKVELLTSAVQQFANTTNPLEKAILCTSIIRWGYVPPAFQMPEISKLEQNNLPFFIGNIPSYFSLNLRQLFTRKGWGLFYHYCPAYNDALYYEYLALKGSIAD